MAIRIGYEVGTGAAVDIPLRHLAVTGQTQESGKTTTLDALVQRAGVTALAFVTKRGESAFAGGRRVQPYFRDRADWQFVTSILDATLQEKNKFLRPWIMKICRTTHSLADVQQAVRKALETAKGINEGVYTQLDAYLDLLVPEIQRAKLAPSLDIRAGLNVMDVSASPTPMQMLLVQSALDWVNEHARNTVVIVPEAWEFVPEGKGSPVKASATTLVRKGAGIGNYIWVDSQDMAGVDKTILRGCAVWIIGVQREANEIKRNLANIPASIKRPTAAQVATLERGQFYVCHGAHAVKTYVQPAWMEEEEAYSIARGLKPIPRRTPSFHHIEEPTVKESEARALREENEALRRRLDEFEWSGRDGGTAERSRPAAPPAPKEFSVAESLDNEALYQAFKKRILAEAATDPVLLRVITQRPELRVEVVRQVITVDGQTVRGRIAKFIADGFFEQSRTSSDVLLELEKRGKKPSNIELGNELKGLMEMGFLTRENKWYSLVPGMAVNIVER